MSTVGFLGIGRMGAAIAGRLGRRRRSAHGVEPQPHRRRWTTLAAAGATVADTAADALAAPVSFSMLADDGAAESVLSRVNLGRSDERRIHVNMASISAAMADQLARRFADAGMTYVSAPVLGRPEVAAQGKLNIMVAGPSDAIEAVDPYLAHCSVRRWRFGETPRQANAVKIAVNFLILQSLESLGESIALVESQDVDAEEFVELLGSSLFGGVVHTGLRRHHRPAPLHPARIHDRARTEGSRPRRAARPRKVGSTCRWPGAARSVRDRAGRPRARRLDWAAVAEVSRRRELSLAAQASPRPHVVFRCDCESR